MMIGHLFVYADTQFYGQANISYQKTHTEISANSDQWELNSNSSRIGIRGEIPVDNSGISAFYQAEYEVAFDDGEATTDETFKQRNTFIGVKGEWGTVLAGHTDTATKEIRRQVDLFNDLAVGDVKNYMSGENRMKNTLRYHTPRLFERFSGSVAVVSDEDSNQDNNDGSTISLSYQHNKFILAVAHDEDINEQNLSRAIAHFETGDFGIGALIQTAENTGSDSTNRDEVASLLSLEYHATEKLDLKIQTGQADIELDNNDQQFKQVAIGIDYNLNKSVMAYGYGAEITRKTSGASTLKDRTAGVGMVLRF